MPGYWNAHSDLDYHWQDEPEPEWDEEDEYDPGEECGRWDNGRLDKLCQSAGTEFCDWICPYRGSL
jgi:hypothetical protein